ncbi:TetR/AcrR family transcriptional regulator [Blastomonas sp. AAP53]|uniref:TetR/AcrR family transcriptional regulator n=1 Tax=Blastomonas sp. AAP53 TaxID=1248760 RepID=UPI00187BDE8F|nr:TetR/AcrR family transcriptional regulator [Blastomonas sp. AAP53]
MTRSQGDVAVSVSKREVVLDPKAKPSQDRARATYELIIETTGELLAEIGFERLSTNMIAERAGLTPPALYRYFPNKYAVLREMGRRLLSAEAAVIQKSMLSDHYPIGGDLKDEIQHRAKVMHEVRKVVEARPGGAWIYRAMRAVPVLRDVHCEAVRIAADAALQRMVKDYPKVDPRRVRAASLMSAVVIGAVNELIHDEPELAELLTLEASTMVTLYARDVALSRAPTAHAANDPEVHATQNL